jgi:hypothetical protein
LGRVVAGGGGGLACCAFGLLCIAPLFGLQPQALLPAFQCLGRLLALARDVLRGLALCTSRTASPRWQPPSV